MRLLDNMRLHLTSKCIYLFFKWIFYAKGKTERKKITWNVNLEDMSIGSFEPIQERNGAGRSPEDGRGWEETPERISEEIIRHWKATLGKKLIENLRKLGTDWTLELRRICIYGGNWWSLWTFLRFVHSASGLFFYIFVNWNQILLSRVVHVHLLDRRPFCSIPRELIIIINLFTILSATCNYSSMSMAISTTSRPFYLLLGHSHNDPTSISLAFWQLFELSPQRATQRYRMTYPCCRKCKNNNNNWSYSTHFNFKTEIEFL